MTRRVGFESSVGLGYVVLGFSGLLAMSSACSTDEFEPFTELSGGASQASGAAGFTSGGRGGAPAQGGVAGSSPPAAGSGSTGPAPSPEVQVGGSASGGVAGVGGDPGGGAPDSLADGGASLAGSGGAPNLLPLGPQTITLVSAPGYPTYDADPQTVVSARSLGAAQAVCLNESYPVDCPSGALLYGFDAVGWDTDRSAIPGARWIWGPGIQPTSVADLAAFVFTRSVELGEGPSGSLAIIADDQATVVVNGRTVLTVGSTTDVSTASFDQSRLTSVSLTRHLLVGSNTISVIVRNGSKDFSGCEVACTYAANPAGVVFSATLKYGE